MSAEKPDKLIEFVANLAGDRFLRVERELGGGYFQLNVGEAERRQAKHDIRSVEDVVVELVRNSRDAGATQIFISSTKNGQGLRELTVIDNGAGIDSGFWDAIFEPRVTSKIDQVVEDRYGVHGRGMALYSIRSQVEDIKLVSSGTGRGAVFRVAINTRRLRERKDQSTFPRLKRTAENRAKIVSGPHNVLRHLAEINLDHPQIEIFYGAPAEILATLVDSSAVDCPAQTAPIWRAETQAVDAGVMSRRAWVGLGLKVSVRNCQRIAGGQIPPIRSIKSELSIPDGQRQTVKRSNRSPVGPIAEADLETFAQEVAESFRNLGEKYFLKIDGPPRIDCSKRVIRVELPVVGEDTW